MLLFRSEEHVRNWYRDTELPAGGALSLPRLWDLARRWYADRASPGWRRFTPAEAEGVFRDVGLTGDFWRLVASEA